MQLIVVCRFFPGGRTAVTLCCGIVGYSRRRFVVATAASGLIWASYSFFIGRLGGRAFRDAPWAGFAVAFGVTVALSGLVELIRRIMSRRRGTATSGRGHAGPAEADDPGEQPSGRAGGEAGPNGSFTGSPRQRQLPCTRLPLNGDASGREVVMMRSICTPSSFARVAVPPSRW